MVTELAVGLKVSVADGYVWVAAIVPPVTVGADWKTPFVRVTVIEGLAAVSTNALEVTPANVI